MTDVEMKQVYVDTIKGLLETRTYYLEQGDADEVKRIEALIIRSIPGYTVAESFFQWLFNGISWIAGWIFKVIEFLAGVFPALSTT